MKKKVCLLFSLMVLVVTMPGCALESIPNVFNEQMTEKKLNKEEQQIVSKAHKMMEKFLNQNYPEAEFFSTQEEILTSKENDQLKTDYCRGSYKLNGVIYEYVVNAVTGDIYTSYAKEDVAALYTEYVLGQIKLPYEKARCNYFEPEVIVKATHDETSLDTVSLFDVYPVSCTIEEIVDDMITGTSGTWSNVLGIGYYGEQELQDYYPDLSICPSLSLLGLNHIADKKDMDFEIHTYDIGTKPITGKEFDDYICLEQIEIEEKVRSYYQYSTYDVEPYQIKYLSCYEMDYLDEGFQSKEKEIDIYEPEKDFLVEIEDEQIDITLKNTGTLEYYITSIQKQDESEKIVYEHNSEYGTDMNEYNWQNLWNKQIIGKELKVYCFTTYNKDTFYFGSKAENVEMN